MICQICKQQFKEKDPVVYITLPSGMKGWVCYNHQGIAKIARSEGILTNGNINDDRFTIGGALKLRFQQFQLARNKRNKPVDKKQSPCLKKQEKIYLKPF